MQIRKSQPFIFLVLILGIFVLGFAFVVLTQPLQTVYNDRYNMSVMQEPDYQLFFIRAKTVWLWILFPIAIMMVIWTIRMIMKKNDYGG